MIDDYNPELDAASSSEIEGTGIGLGDIDELFAGLSALFEGEQPEWLDAEVPRYRAARARAEAKKEADESERRVSREAAEMQRVQQQSRDRRCRDGLCCVYSMRYRPSHAFSYHRPCKHVCRSNDERYQDCHTPLFARDLFQIFHAKHTRSYITGNIKTKRESFASYARWEKLDQANKRARMSQKNGIIRPLSPSH